jgi:uncharacterized delta-60 repeat protein
MIERTRGRIQHKRGQCAGGLAVALGALVLVAPTSAGERRAGDLDPSFGHHGRVVLRDVRGIARAVAVGRHHRIVVAGSTHGDFTVTRLFSDGGVENRFGHHGIAKLSFGTNSARATSVALGRKGAIVVAGTVCDHHGNCHFAVARLQRDGEIDRGFGDDGIVEIDFPGAFDYARSVVLAAQGQIVVGGSDCDLARQDCAIALAALQRDGMLDPGFGDGGKVLSSRAGPGDSCEGTYRGAGRVTGMALDSRGRIVVGAKCMGPTAVIARFEPNGGPDQSFGTGGIAERDLGMNAVGALAIDSQDRIDALGARGPVVKVARVTPKGRLDRSFGNDGTARIRFARKRGDSAWKYRVDPSSVAIDSRGRIVVGGQRYTPGLAFARFKSNGRVDRHFGSRGRVIVTGGEKPWWKKPLFLTGNLAIDARDRIIGLGDIRERVKGTYTSGHFAMIRLLG